MGRILTDRYSALFEKRIHNPFKFVRDIHKTGKSREFLSFIVWEMFHKLRLFSRNRYLEIQNAKALSLENAELNDPNFQASMERFFKDSDLRLNRVEHNWKLLFITREKKIFGCLYPDDRRLYTSLDKGKSVDFVQSFPNRIKSIFTSSQNTVFVCTKGAVYRGSNNGTSFHKTLELGSAESFFRHNNSMTETPDGVLIIAEYGNIWDENGWRKLAYLYFSADDGQTWETSDFLIQKGTNKHVHLVKYSQLFNKVFMADGDNYKRFWVNESRTFEDVKNPDRWKPVNRFHIQTGGYTSVVETDEKILFGTDYQGGTNFIVETKDGEKFRKRIVPDPYRRSPIINMVQRRSKPGNEIWAVLPYSTANTKCLLMYSKDGGESWKKVLEYGRVNHHVALISSSNEMEDELYISIEDLENGDRAVYKVAE